MAHDCSDTPGEKDEIVSLSFFQKGKMKKTQSQQWEDKSGKLSKVEYLELIPSS